MIDTYDTDQATGDDRVDRLRAVGNAVVPAVAEHVGRLIVAADAATLTAAA